MAPQIHWLQLVLLVTVIAHLCDGQQGFYKAGGYSAGGEGGFSSSGGGSYSGQNRHSTTTQVVVESSGGSSSSGGGGSASVAASATGGLGGVFSDIVGHLKEGSFNASGHINYIGKKKEEEKKKLFMNQTTTDDSYLYGNHSWDADFWKRWGGKFMPGFDISFTEVRIPILQVNYKGVAIIRKTSHPQIIENGIRIPLQYALINLQQYPALEVFFQGDNIAIDKEIKDIGQLKITIDGVQIPIDTIKFPEFSLLSSRTLYQKIFIRLETDPGVLVTYHGHSTPFDKESSKLITLSKVYLTVGGGLLPGFYLPYFVKLDGFQLGYHGVLVPLTSRTLNLLNVPGVKLFFHGSDVSRQHNIYDILSLLGVKLLLSGRPVPITNDTIGLLGNRHGATLTLHTQEIRIINVGSVERFDFFLADFPELEHHWPDHDVEDDVEWHDRAQWLHSILSHYELTNLHSPLPHGTQTTVHVDKTIKIPAQHFGLHYVRTSKDGLQDGSYSTGYQPITEAEAEELQHPHGSHNIQIHHDLNVAAERREHALNYYTPAFRDYWAGLYDNSVQYRGFPQAGFPETAYRYVLQHGYQYAPGAGFWTAIQNNGYRGRIYRFHGATALIQRAHLKAQQQQQQVGDGYITYEARYPGPGQGVGEDYNTAYDDRRPGTTHGSVQYRAFQQAGFPGTSYRS